MPKGVILSHENFIATTASYAWATKKNYGIAFNHEDVHISYLPLAHVMERVVVSLLMGVGARLGSFQIEIRVLSRRYFEIT